MTDALVQRGPLWGHTPASQKRRRDILVAGKHVFFESGYALASIDRIAAVSGTTKRTVYDHFGSKDALFAEVIAFACGKFVEMLPSADSLPTPISEGLPLFIVRFTEIITRLEIVRFQRLVIAEAERHPQFGQVLYETALLGAERVLADYLRARIADGQIPVQDADRSARFIQDLTSTGPRLRSLVAIETVDVTVDASTLDLALALVMDGSTPFPKP